MVQPSHEDIRPFLPQQADQAEEGNRRRKTTPHSDTMDVYSRVSKRIYVHAVVHQGDYYLARHVRATIVGYYAREHALSPTQSESCNQMKNRAQ